MDSEFGFYFLGLGLIMIVNLDSGLLMLGYYRSVWDRPGSPLAGRASCWKLASSLSGVFPSGHGGRCHQDCRLPR